MCRNQDLIRVRTSEGRARAVANGVKLGCKPTLTPHQRREAIERVNAEKGNARRDRALLQCEPMDNFEVDQLTIATKGCLSAAPP
jgi:hypothetical protein